MNTARIAYESWIRATYPTPESALGQCETAAHAMAAAFPELRVAKGHVMTPAWGERQHWWCVDGDGVIVDPTAHQFPGGASEYREWKEGDPVAVGRCMECGELILDPDRFTGRRPFSTTACSQACADGIAAYYDLISR